VLLDKTPFKIICLGDKNMKNFFLFLVAIICCTQLHAKKRPDRRRDTTRVINMYEQDTNEIKTIPEINEIIQELAQEDSDLKALRSSPAQTIGLNFTAATVANVLDPFVIPPNLNGWVGPQQYVLMTYNIIRSFNKNTGIADGVLNIDAASFFGVSANDVRIDYDRFSQRWFMSCEGINESTGQIATIILAVSNSSVLTNNTVWSLYTFTNAQVIPQIRPLGSGDLDYQQLAIDSNAVYISVDTFDKNGNFAGSSVLVIQKNSLGSSNLVCKVFSGLLKTSTFIAPADNFDVNSSFGYLINALNNQYPSSQTYNQLYFYRINNPGTTNPSLGPLLSIPVPLYTDAANAPYAGNLFGSKAYLQTSSCALYASHVRNHQLFTVHNIQVNKSGISNTSGDRVGVRWYQFDLTGDATGQARGTESSATVPALVQSGTLFDTAMTNPKYYFNPSIMINKNGDMVIACTVSGLTSYPNVIYAGRKSSDPKGTLRTPASITNASNSYNFGPFVDPSNANIGQRWGDLSSLCPDPTNDLDIWATQEFAAIQNGWGIRVTQLKPAA